MSQPANITEILDKLKNVKKTAAGWTADCPCNGHETPEGHLSLSDAGDKALVSCFNTHNYDDICQTLGYTSLGYKPPEEPKEPRRIVKTYDYTDEKGNLLYQVVRYEPKDFRQRRPDGKGGWIWNLNDVRRVLFRLPEVRAAINRHEDIVFCEGEKDCLTVTEQTGLVATTNAMGAGKLANYGYEESLRGAYLVICGDNDAPGKNHVELAAGLFYGTAAKIKILTLPAEVKDVSDWFKAGGTPDAYHKMIAEARVYTPEGLPNIVVSNRQLPGITNDVLEALYHANNPPVVFRRSGLLTRVVVDETGRPKAETFSEAALRGRVARVANYIRINAEGSMIPTMPLDKVVQDIASLSELEFFPKLTGITESPVLRIDGSILSDTGYDNTTGLYYMPVDGVRLGLVPSHPEPADVVQAANLIREVFCDFPFKDEASRTGAIATLIGTVLKSSLINDLAPMAVIDKPQAGTGASLIANVISIIATGHNAPMMGPPADEAEWDKRLFSILLDAQNLCVIDNVERKLSSATLAQYLTSQLIRSRVLSESHSPVLQNNMSFIATGNNIQLGSDLPRRCYHVRLDAREARPWLRNIQYKHDPLLPWVRSQRGNILAAIFTIARAWMNAGRPPGGTPILGNYEVWCAVVGGILAYADIKEFLGNLEEMYEQTDTDTPEWEGFLASWYEILGEKEIRVADLKEKLSENKDLAAALPKDIISKDGVDYSRRLGNALAKQNGRRFNNELMLTKAGSFRHTVTWKVTNYKTDAAQGGLPGMSPNATGGTEKVILGQPPAEACPACKEEDWGVTEDVTAYKCMRCGYVYGRN